MSFTTVIIIVIIFLLVKSVLKKGPETGSADAPRPVLRNPAGGKWHLMDWMETAGELDARFNRPEGPSGVPGIEGQCDGFRFTITANPYPTAEEVLYVVCYFSGSADPDPAKLQLVKSLFPPDVKIHAEKHALSVTFPGTSPSAEVLRTAVKAVHILYPDPADVPSLEEAEETVPVAESPEPVKAPVAPPEKAEPAAETLPQSLTKEYVSDHLFRQGFPGETEKKFFDSVKGRKVEWTAVVRSSYSYSSDFVFGNGKGVRCTLDLCEVTNSFGSRQMARAVAAFPPEAYETLRSSAGKEIRFRGELLKMEPFSKEIYLKEGELL